MDEKNYTSSSTSNENYDSTSIGAGSMESSSSSEYGSSSDYHPKASFKETFRTGSPEDVKEKVKDVVAKGVAAVAGALRGFTEESQKNKLSDQSKSAVRTAGETASGTIGSVTEQVQGLKQPIKDAGQKISETVRDISQTTRSEYQSTKEAVKGSSSSGATSSGSMTSSYNEASSSSIGAVGGSASTGLGTEMPDIRNTPLAKSDKELKGKDLTDNLE